MPRAQLGAFPDDPAAARARVRELYDGPELAWPDPPATRDPGASALEAFDVILQEVERLRYYHQLGVKIRACALAAHDFDYSAEDFYDFVELAPSAMTELVYWQQQGYGLIKPEILEKRFSVEEIR